MRIKLTEQEVLAILCDHVADICDGEWKCVTDYDAHALEFERVDDKASEPKS